MNAFKKLFLVLKNLKIINSFYFLVLLSIIASLLEVLSITSVLPLVGMLIDPEAFKQYAIFNHLFKFFDQFNLARLNLFNDQNQIVLLFIFVIFVIFVIKFFFQLFFEWYRANIVYIIDYKLTSYLYNFYLNKTYNFHVDTNTSKLHRNIQGDAKAISNIFRSIVIIFTEILIILGLLSVLFFLYWKITAIALFLLVFAGAAILFFTGKLNFILGKKLHIETQKRIKFLIDGFEGIKDFIIYDKIKVFYEMFDVSNKEYGKASKIYSILIILPKLIIEFLFILGILAVLSSFILSEKSLDQFLPLIALFIISIVRIAPSTFRIINSSQQIRFNKASIDHIFKDVISAIKLVDIKNPVIIKNEINFHKKLELKNVNFSYKNNKKILRNLNFSISKGQCIGIFGSSGTGKSTLLNIITGLFQADSGKVLSDENNIYKNIKSWRKNIGYVPQNVYLLDENIKKNISLNLNSNSLNKINFEYALKISGLKEMNKNLTLRLQKTLGEKGRKISGGQAQRIGIARAIYNKPSILIFDEATNSLDKKIELKIFDSIYKLKNKNTIIIVSHKLQLLKKCHKVYEFNKGKLYNKKII